MSIRKRSMCGKKNSLIEKLGAVALLSGVLAAGCSGDQLVGDYAGTHTYTYELTSSTAGAPNDVLPVVYMGLVSVYRNGDAYSIDLSGTCTLKGSMGARNSITIDQSDDTPCTVKVRNVPADCRATGNITDMRLAFLSPMHIYLTTSNDLSLDGQFIFHPTENPHCRDTFVKATYTFAGTESQL